MSVDADGQGPGERRLNKDRRAPRRQMYSGRALAFTAAISATVAALCSIIAILTISSDTGNKTCTARRDLQDESNRRAPLHAEDADNLARLATALSAHRTIEAQVFARIGRDFKIKGEVKPLVAVLRLGAREDAEIAREERQIHFKQLTVSSC